MENIEKDFTPEESLQLISQIITKTRRNIKVGSFFFILWGWIVIFSSVSCFFVIKYFCAHHLEKYLNLACWLTWIIPTIIGFIISNLHAKKMEKTERVKSQIGSIIKAIWYTNALGIFISCFISYKMKSYPAPIILTIVGISTFLTGYIIKFRPLILGGIIFGLLAIFSCFIMNEYQLLVTALGILSGYLIPGYILKYSKI